MLKCIQCCQIHPCPTCEHKHGSCVNCGKPINRTSTRCRSCQGKRIPQPAQHPKIDWPDHDLLDDLVYFLGYRETGRRLGVSDNAVRKHKQKEPCTELCLGGRLAAQHRPRKRSGKSGGAGRYLRRVSDLPYTGGWNPAI